MTDTTAHDARGARGHDSGLEADAHRAHIDVLLALVAPPGDGGIADVDWGAFQEELGWEAPADYRGIVTRHGVGQFSGEFFVFAPGGDEGQDIYTETPTFLDIITDPSWQEYLHRPGLGPALRPGRLGVVPRVGADGPFPRRQGPPIGLGGSGVHPLPRSPLTNSIGGR
ncbi:hypothetical protein ACXVUM_17895 [Williamsia sp. SKLECPSW1]